MSSLLDSVLKQDLDKFIELFPTSDRNLKLKAFTEAILLSRSSSSILMNMIQFALQIEPTIMNWVIEENSVKWVQRPFDLAVEMLNLDVIRLYFESSGHKIVELTDIDAYPYGGIKSIEGITRRNFAHAIEGRSYEILDLFFSALKFEQIRRRDIKIFNDVNHPFDESEDVRMMNHRSGENVCVRSSEEPRELRIVFFFEDVKMSK